MEKLKLNYKNTFLVGLAFMAIQIFWTTYDFIIPLMLNRTFGLSDSFRGFIMGLDNILALFLLPLFGSFSDRTHTRFGKRTPFIFIGTVAAAIFMLILPMTENIQLNKAEQISQDTPNEVLWDYTTEVEKKLLIDYKGYTFDVKNLTEAQKNTLRNDFNAIVKTTTENGKEVSNPHYADIVQPALRAYIFKNVSSKTPMALISFMVVLLMLLISMGIYRSPAVALMPDVTPEPLRSPANAVINLMGGIGAVLAMLARTILLATSGDKYYSSYSTVFLAIDAIMVICTAVFLITVRENKLLSERDKVCQKFGIESGIDSISEKKNVRLRDLSDGSLRYFFIALVAIGLSTMGSGAFTASISVYFQDNMGFTASQSSNLAMIAYVVSGIAFIPVGYLAMKLGRKKTIMIGFLLACLSMFAGFFITREYRGLFIAIYFIFNVGNVIYTVNTLPLVLEHADSNTVGKFTGYYYTATMLASAITPFLSGLFMETSGRAILFIYGGVFMALSMVVLYFVKGLGERSKTIVK